MAKKGTLKYQGVLQKETIKYTHFWHALDLTLTILMEYNLFDTYPLSDELTIKLLSNTMLALDKHRTGAVWPTRRHRGVICKSITHNALTEHEVS